MAALRKASSYSRKRTRPYTRKSKRQQKSYIKVIPHNKIVKYNMGNLQAHNLGKFKNYVRLISTEKILIRDNSVESCRQLLNKTLDRKVPGRYYLEVRIYPHHILRNNKTAAGAGADRLSTGMSHSFGVVEGRAAIVPAGKDIFLVTVEAESDVKSVREAMTMVKAKLPGRTKINFQKVN